MFIKRWCNFTTEDDEFPFIHGDFYVFLVAYKLKLSLCLINYALRHDGVWGRCIDSRFLDLGTSWR
jgi:hypothetical protein